ncbi:MAG: hypothetical protein HQM11_13565 [SAR324 cluster bacterium]|nr:hypothetical protein [SAR324 cluster bacterium]
MQSKELINPYTQAMADCLLKIQHPPEHNLTDDMVIYFLTNMIQGRMLEHLIARIDEFYQIRDAHFRTELAMVLVDVFNESIFGAFRKKVESKPDIVFTVARHIVEVECHTGLGHQSRVNHLYLCIFRKYLDYQNLESIIQTLQSNPQIQKLILTFLLKKNLNKTSYNACQYMLDQDSQNVMTNVFILCVKNYYPLRNKLHKASHKFKSRFLHLNRFFNH